MIRKSAPIKIGDYIACLSLVLFLLMHPAALLSAEHSKDDPTGRLYWQSLIWVAWGYNYLGEPSEAERTFKKALKVSSPNNCHVLLGLASMYQENLEFEQAIAQIEKVKEIAPNFGRVDEARKEIIAKPRKSACRSAFRHDLS